MAIAIAVRVRFFARLRELAGAEVEALEVAPGSTIGGVYAELRRRHPALPGEVAIGAALNHEVAGWGDVVADGDEVAFIPPVSGGTV